ncbi:MAG: Rab family GTPase [Candidatus Hodarchaeota archaeon]
MLITFQRLKVVVIDIQYRPSNNLKIVVAGEGGVGKTTMIESLKCGHFYPNTMMTIAVQFHTMAFEFDDRTVNLQIWDLGGQRHFFNMGIFRKYYHGAHATLLCFDITDLDTLEEIPKWIDILPPKIPRILVGTKADMTDESGIEDIKAIAQPYLETFKLNGFLFSDITNILGIQNIFRTLIALSVDVQQRKGTIDVNSALVAKLVTKK